MSRRTTSLLATAIAVVALGVGACGGSAQEEKAGTSPDAAPAPLELTLPEDQAGRCMMPNAEALANQEIAFEGTVSELAGGHVELYVERWFTADEGETVVVAAPSEQLQDLLLAVRFEEGKTYLVSATDGRVSLCGFTAEKNPELEELYLAAFEGS